MAEDDNKSDNKSVEMKVSMKKGIGFYIRSAAAFLKGVDAREATEGKEAQEARPAVDELKISGLGDAINTAIAAAARAETDKLGEITKIETCYPEMTQGRGCAQILITLKRI